MGFEPRTSGIIFSVCTGRAVKPPMLIQTYFLAKRRIPNVQHRLHLHALGQLLRQVQREERSFAGNSGVAAVGQKEGQERAKERDGPFQKEGERLLRMKKWPLASTRQKISRPLSYYTQTIFSLPIRLMLGLRPGFL